MGITNQRETTVLWDRRSGLPLHHALVWHDTRTEELVREYAREGGPDRFRKKTGLPLASYFSALKLNWLLQHVPNARALAESGDALFGTIDSWLVWNLTGGPNGGMHITDVTNASRTQLMNLATLSWDPELLAAFKIPAACLPKIVSSSEPYSVARAGPLSGVQIAGILGDQQAALVGQACFEAGEAKNTYGTGCFLLMNTGTQPVDSKAGLVTTVIAAMEQDCGFALKELRVDGGMVVNELLMQFQADILNVPVIRPKAIETTALGAAYAAGLAVGHWKGLGDLKSNWRVAGKWMPQVTEVVRARLYGSWKKAVDHSLGWITT